MDEKRIEEAKVKMEAGWKLREDWKFEEGEKLLSEAKAIFEEEGDWFNVTECLNHLAYTRRIQAVQRSSEGVSLARESLELSNTHNTKKVLALRALVSTLTILGNFEEALKRAKEAAGMFDDGAAKADILASVSKLELRCGRSKEALERCEEAEQMLTQYWESEREPHRSIWKAGLMMTKATILYNMGSEEEARKLGEEVLIFAEEKDLKTRVIEAKAFLGLFS